MKNSFKVKKHNGLSNREYLVYATLSCYSNWKGESHITREKISQKTGIKDLDTISKITSLLVKKGLVKKTSHHTKGRNLVSYQVVNQNRDFMWISNDIFKLDPKMIAFILRLAEFRFGEGNWIGLSNNELIKQLKIGRSTFFKLLGEGLREGFIRKNNSGYVIDNQLIMNDCSKSISEMKMELIDYQSVTIKSFYFSYIDKVDNPKAFERWCLGGCPRKKRLINDKSLTSII